MAVHIFVGVKLWRYVTECQYHMWLDSLASSQLVTGMPCTLNIVHIYKFKQEYLNWHCGHAFLFINQHIKDPVHITLPFDRFEHSHW